MLCNDTTIVFQGWRAGQSCYLSIVVPICSSAKTHPATVVMVLLEIKIAVFTCLLSSEGCDSFSKHLDLALALNKTNEGVKKQ